MPIRNSKVPSGDAFKVHRKARLSGLQSPAVTEAMGQSAEGQNADLETNEASPLKLDRTSGSKPDAVPVAPSKGQSSALPLETEADRHGTASSEPQMSEASVFPRRTRRPGQVADTGQLRLQMTVAHPADGVSPTFDQLASVENTKVAFRLVLGKALETYAAAVADGILADMPTTYPESSGIVKTSRMFPKDAYAKLMKVLNPSGLLSDRSMGTMIGRRALAAFVANDKGFG